MVLNPDTDNKPADKMAGIFLIIPIFLQIIPAILEIRPTIAGIVLVAVIGVAIACGFYFASGSNEPPSFPIEKDSEDATTSMDLLKDLKKEDEKVGDKRPAVYNENTKIINSMNHQGLKTKKMDLKYFSSPDGPSETKGSSGSGNDVDKQTPNNNEAPINAAVVNKNCDIGNMHTFTDSTVDEIYMEFREGK